MTIHLEALGLPPIRQGEETSIKKSLRIYLILRLFFMGDDFSN